MITALLIMTALMYILPINDNLWRVSSPFSTSASATRVHSSGFGTEGSSTSVNDIYGITGWSSTQLLLSIQYRTDISLFGAGGDIHKAFLLVNKNNGIATAGFFRVKNTRYPTGKEPIEMVGNTLYICYRGAGGSRIFGRTTRSALQSAFNANPLLSAPKRH